MWKICLQPAPTILRSPLWGKYDATHGSSTPILSVTIACDAITTGRSKVCPSRGSNHPMPLWALALRWPALSHERVLMSLRPAHPRWWQAWHTQGGDGPDQVWWGSLVVMPVLPSALILVSLKGPQSVTTGQTDIHWWLQTMFLPDQPLL